MQLLISSEIIQENFKDRKKKKKTLQFSYPMVVHMLGVPVRLRPVLRRVLFHKVADSRPELIGLQNQELDDEEPNLGLVAFVAPQRLCEHTNCFSHTFL